MYEFLPCHEPEVLAFCLFHQKLAMLSQNKGYSIRYLDQTFFFVSENYCQTVTFSFQSTEMHLLQKTKKENRRLLCTVLPRSVSHILSC